MRNRIRVLLLAPLVTTGGITTWTKLLLRLSGNIDWHVLDTSKTYEKVTISLGLRGACFGLVVSVRRFGRLCCLLVKVRPDAVFLTCAPTIGLVRDALYCILLRHFGYKVIMHLREGDTVGFFEGGRSVFRRCFAKIAEKAFSRSSCLIAITRKVEAEAKKRFPGTLIVYVPNMIECLDRTGPLAELSQTDEKYDIRIVHVGWQDERKGVFELLEALTLTKCRVLLNLVGDTDPENMSRIQKAMDRVPSGSTAVFNGPLYGSALWRMYYSAELFVFPSRSEGFPNVLLEAMSAGLPAVVTDIGNMREMIAADSDVPGGLICRVQDPEDIAEKIDVLAGDKEYRSRLGVNARNRVMQFYDASVVIPRIETLIETIMRK